MATFDQPGQNQIADKSGGITAVWSQWVTRIHAICTANQQSGPTAFRPDKLVWLGRRYYDTDLHMPIYVDGVNPIKWVDSMGNVV